MTASNLEPAPRCSSPAAPESTAECLTGETGRAPDRVTASGVKQQKQQQQQLSAQVTVACGDASDSNNNNNESTLVPEEAASCNHEPQQTAAAAAVSTRQREDEAKLAHRSQQQQHHHHHHQAAHAHAISIYPPPAQPPHSNFVHYHHQFAPLQSFYHHHHHQQPLLAWTCPIGHPAGPSLQQQQPQQLLQPTAQVYYQPVAYPSPAHYAALPQHHLAGGGPAFYAAGVPPAGADAHRFHVTHELGGGCGAPDKAPAQIEDERRESENQISTGAGIGSSAPPPPASAEQSDDGGQQGERGQQSDKSVNGASSSSPPPQGPLDTTGQQQGRRRSIARRDKREQQQGDQTRASTSTGGPQLNKISYQSGVAAAAEKAERAQGEQGSCQMCASSAREGAAAVAVAAATAATARPRCHDRRSGPDDGSTIESAGELPSSATPQPAPCCHLDDDDESFETTKTTASCSKQAKPAGAAPGRDQQTMVETPCAGVERQQQQQQQQGAEEDKGEEKEEGEDEEAVGDRPVFKGANLDHPTPTSITRESDPPTTTTTTGGSTTTTATNHQISINGTTFYHVDPAALLFAAQQQQHPQPAPPPPHHLLLSYYNLANIAAYHQTHLPPPPPPGAGYFDQRYAHSPYASALAYHHQHQSAAHSWWPQSAHFMPPAMPHAATPQVFSPYQLRQPLAQTPPPPPSHHYEAQISHLQQQQQQQQHHTSRLQTAPQTITTTSVQSTSTSVSQLKLGYNLIPLLPIQAIPTRVRQAYGMDKVWQDEFEQLFAQFISQVVWTLVEVETNPSVRASSRILDYKNRYVVRVLDCGPPLDVEQVAVVSSRAVEHSTPVDVDVDVDEKEETDQQESDTSNDLKETTGKHESMAEQERDQEEERASNCESDCDSGAVLNSSSTTSSGGSSSFETSVEGMGPGETSGSVVRSLTPMTTDSAAAGGGGGGGCDAAGEQQEQQHQHQQSNPGQTTRKFPLKFRMFIDSAKVRFCCETCGHGWTSMKGRVVFWYELFELVDGAQSETAPVKQQQQQQQHGVSNLIGYCAYKLFGQQCDVCKVENRFERPMWYPEEVTKVLCNLYNKIGQVYFGFRMPAIDKQRRAGKPKTSHNSLLCQACHDGVCTDRK